MKRRIAVQAIFSLALSAIFTKSSAGKPRTIHVSHHVDDLVFDQSGTFNSSAFVMGILTVGNPAEMAKKASLLRKRLGFRCTLTHASRNKWKQKYARSLIDLWWASPDAKIHAFVVQEDPSLADRKSSEKLSRYVDLVSRLIDTSRKNIPRDARLVTQRHLKATQQAQFEKLLALRNSEFKSAIHISESQSDLLQLVDLFVGTIQANLTVNESHPTNKLKRDLSDYLKKKLGVKTLDQAIKHPRCSLTYV